MSIPSLKCAGRNAFVTLGTLFGITMAGIAVHTAAGQSPVTNGVWNTLPYLMPINPIHCGMTHTGKVLVVAGSENDPDEQEYRAAVYDPETGTIVVQDLLWDVFCNGMAALPDGRWVIVGGNEQYDPFYGEPRATVFDPATEKFNEVESMAHGRWYATVIELTDGSLMAFSGLNEIGEFNKSVEIYAPATGWSAEYVAPWTAPLYPRLHLLPDGNVFYAAEGTSSHLFNPTTKTWTLNVAHTVYSRNRSYGSTILLPLRPETGYIPKVLSMGGDDPATATAEIIDLSASTPSWRSTAPMSLPRIQMNAVILPTGKVLALGGSAINEDPNTASLAADLFDPASETWAPAGAGQYPRLYHSVGLLLPDATVWVAGSNPVRGSYEEHMEIYSPAYLFTVDGSGNVIPASRPTITKIPTEIGYGTKFNLETPNPTDISSAVLVRPGSPTHSFDMEQRLVSLVFQPGLNGTVKTSAPPNGSIAPPGYYMLFLINQAGVPSEAKFIHLTSMPKDRPPEGEITSPAGDLSIRAGQAVDFTGRAKDRDGAVTAYSWVFPGGTPPKSSSQSPGRVRFKEAGTYVISMTAFDEAGANDPSPPTRMIIVQPGSPPFP
jgi:Galactose oxidase-like, Early set domain/Glyoxal oxidase N-terminus/PKD domain